MTDAAPTVGPRPAARTALALACGLAAVLALVIVFPPGRYDLSPGDLTGTMAHDEGYWSGPAREISGRVTFDRYDRERALCLALPQNLAGAAAHALGLSEDVTRNAGSLLAAFALGALAAFVGWAGKAALLAMLVAPPVWGHLRGDLGEGPTLALVAWWAWLASRRRFGLAAFIAVLGVYQKGCGLFLGVGTLAGIVFAPREERLGTLRRAVVGGLVALLLLSSSARLVFHDDPVDVLVRPFRMTDDFWVAPGLSSMAVQAAFPGYQLFGEYLAPLFLAAALVATRRRVGVAWLVAAVAGLAYRGYFAANWRFVPVIPLLALPAVAPPSLGPALSGRLLGGIAWVQAAVGIVAWTGWGPGAIGLALLALVTLPLVVWGWPRVSPSIARGALAAALVVAVVVPVARASARADGIFSSRAHALADAVADRVPEGAFLVGQPVASLRFRGTFALSNMEKHWAPKELVAPGRVWRVEARDRDDDPGWASPPSSMRIEKKERLGRFPYSPSSWPRDVWLDLWVEKEGR